jgi:hypothetical protein
MKKLKLNRETVRNLTNTELGEVLGGNGTISQVTRACPVMTNGCTGGGCQMTIGTSGTSVINPGPIIILPSGG